MSNDHEAWELEFALNNFVAGTKGSERPFYQLAGMIDHLLKESENSREFVTKFVSALNTRALKKDEPIDAEFEKKGE